jgi:protein-disulfide isomerase
MKRRAIAGLAITVLAVLALAACQKPKAAAPFADTEISLGNAQAKVTVTEYASVACPFCARFNNDEFPAFKAKYVDTGKVHYVFREMLVGNGQEMSMGAAGFIMARCIGKDQYFQVLDEVFKAQDSMYKSGDARSGLLKIAKAHGLDEKAFNDCVTNTDNLAQMNARNDKAGTDGVNSTPTFFVNGKKIYEGVIPLPQLEAAVMEAGA